MVWDTRFERTAMSCDTFEQAKALVAQTGIPQVLRIKARSSLHCDRIW
jgi:hypothetical protein